jgi:peptidoglycan/LPS O-acetylase OafA/YrhL
MLKSLQVCRAGAALLIVVFHTSVSFFVLPKYFSSRPFGHIFDFGYAGLDMLFVLSGFIILHAHRADLGRPERLPRYLYRRAHRVYPTYWAILLVITPLFFLVPSFGDSSKRDLGVIVQSILLLPQDCEPVLGAAWSMPFEMFFYFLFGLMILHRGLGWCAFAGWLVLLVVRPWHSHYPFTFLEHENNFRILTGLVAAEVTHRWQLPRAGLLALVGLAMFLTTGMLQSHTDMLEPAFRSAGYTLGSGLFIAGLAAWEKSREIQVPRLLMFLGDASYAIFLVHMVALSVLAKVTKVTRLDVFVPHAVLFVGFVVAATAVGAAVHLYVELPLRGIRRKKAAPRETAPVEVVAWQPA